MTAFEIGRVAVKTAGRETAKKCIIIGFVDKNFALVSGAGLSGVRRRSANLKHLVPVDKKVNIKENASDEDVAKAISTAGLKDDFVKEYDFTVSNV